MRLLIANRRYSSWSLRGWLAVRQSALLCDVVLLPLDTDAFARAVAGGLLPGGRVSVLWDADTPVWESLAIVEWLAERVSRDHFWPADAAARAHARSVATEMHAGFTALRSACPMDLRRAPAPLASIGPALAADVARVDALSSAAYRRFGEDGPFLYDAFGAADIMYAPVAHRVVAYALPVSPEAARYADAVLTHPWLREWTDGIGDESDIAEQRL